MKERLIRWLLAVLGNKIDWTDETFKRSSKLVDQLMQRLELVEGRLDACEERHRLRDARDEERDRLIATLQDDVVRCHEEHRAVREQLERLERRKPGGMRE